MRKAAEIGNAASVAIQAEGPPVPSVAFLATGGGPQLSHVVRYLQSTLGAASVDLTHQDDGSVLQQARVSLGVFLISPTDPVSLHRARERARWLRSEGLDERCGLILWKSFDGLEATEAEDLVGLPVCGLLKGEQETDALARWIAAEAAA